MLISEKEGIHRINKSINHFSKGRVVDVEEKKRELIDLITGYLAKNVTTQELLEFVWSVIDFFTFTSKKSLPKDQQNEKEFWYAIWEIQHLADTGHELDGVTEKTLKDALDYLKGIKKMPNDFIGKRPKID